MIVRRRHAGRHPADLAELEAFSCGAESDKTRVVNTGHRPSATLEHVKGYVSLNPFGFMLYSMRITSKDSICQRFRSVEKSMRTGGMRTLHGIDNR